MFVVHNIFGISIMSLILAFSAIHLGVGIGIIAPDRSYSDIFRPQIGLASFNLVISILGLATGVLGMLCVLKNADQLGECQLLRWEFDQANCRSLDSVRVERKTDILLIFRSHCGSYLERTGPVHHCFSHHCSGDQFQVIKLSRYACFQSYRSVQEQWTIEWDHRSDTDESWVLWRRSLDRLDKCRIDRHIADGQQYHQYLFYKYYNVKHGNDNNALNHFLIYNDPNNYISCDNGFYFSRCW